MAKRRTSKRRDDDEAAAPCKHGADGTGTAASDRHGGAGADDAPRDEEVVISAPVHCDGCARKLRRSLQRLDGIGEVTVDSRTNTVVLRGPGAAEAVELVERKTGKKSTLLMSPLPAKLQSFPSAAEGKGRSDRTNKSDPAGADDSAGDEEIAAVDTCQQDMVTVLRINLHCDACSQEIKRRVLKIKGVKEAVPLLKSSQVVVKGMVEPATLVGFIHRSTGRKAAIIRAEPLDLLLPKPKEAPQEMDEAETEHQGGDPSANSGEKNDDGDRDLNNDFNVQAPQGEENNKVEER